jgi:hypothetical protein
MEEVKTGESWNKKRVFIAGLLLILLIVGGYFLNTRVFGNNSPQLTESVKGAAVEEITSEPAAKINVQEAVKEKIDSLKQQVSNLNISEIANSSPQVQKILEDIKSLQDYPTNQLKELCRKICGL